MSNISTIYKAIERILWTDKGLNGDAQRIEQFGWMLFFKIFSDKDDELELMSDTYESPTPPELRWSAWAANDEGLTGDDLLRFVDQTLFPELRKLPVQGNPRALLLREVFEGNNNYMKSGTNLRKVLTEFNKIDFNTAKDRHAFGDVYEAILKNLQTAGKSGEFYTPRAVTHLLTELVAPQLGEVVLDPACGTGGFLTAVIDQLKAQATTVAQRQAIQEQVRGWEYKPLPYMLACSNLILHDIEVPHITYRDALDRAPSTYGAAERVDVVLANPPFGGIVANGNEQLFPQNFRTRESADLFLVLILQLLRGGGRAGIVLPDGSLTGEGVKQRVREKLLKDCNLHTIVRLPNSVFQPYATVATNLLFFTKGERTREVWYYEHRLPEGQKAYSKTKPIRSEDFDPLRAWWANRYESEVAWRVPLAEIEARNFDLDIKNPNGQKTVQEDSSFDILQRIDQEQGRIHGIVENLKSLLAQA